MGYTYMEFTSIPGHTSIELKKLKLLTGLACVLEDNYKYALEKEVDVQIFCYNHYHLNHD
jgi:hypothetical protein